MSRSRGFTLLEVLAAIAVLGFAVTVLARSAIQGMRYEGDASRRLAASLIADRLLFEVEAGLALGALPELGLREFEEDDEFRRTLEVAPVDPVQLGLAGAFTRETETPGRSASAAAGAAPTLLLVSVQVAWSEGLLEQSVTRTTFAYDATAAVGALGGGEARADEETAEPVPQRPARRVRLPQRPGEAP